MTQVTHRVLAKLEEIGKLDAIVTQNIDGLHQLAGSKCVYEIHGTTHKNYCASCGERVGENYIFETTRYSQMSEMRRHDPSAGHPV